MYNTDAMPPRDHNTHTPYRYCARDCEHIDDVFNARPKEMRSG